MLSQPFWPRPWPAKCLHETTAMWVKICGITTLEDANMAVAAGADAIGFVFAESPRRVTAEAARKIADSIPPRIEKIGVFVNADLATVLHAVEQAGLTGVQLHGDDPARVGDQLLGRKIKMSGSFRVVQVLHYAGDPGRFALQLRSLTSRSTAADTILVDTGTAGRHGGTGIPFDWQTAQASLLAADAEVRLVVAGGLNPQNVQQAIATLAPWGVDVSSGVESAPGRKDPARVEAFLRAAHAAAPLSGKSMAGMQK